MRALILSLAQRNMSQRGVRAAVADVRANNARFNNKRRAINNATLEEARYESRMLYKRFLRAVPSIMETYKMTDITEKKIYEYIRSEWEATSNVRDPRVVDVLLLKGKQELQELVMHYQQQSHVYRRFNWTHNKKPEGFMGNFLERKDM